MDYWAPIIKELGVCWRVFLNTIMNFVRCVKFLDRLNWYKLLNTSCSIEVAGKNTVVTNRGAHIPGCHIAVATRFCTVASNVCGSSVWTLPRVIVLDLGIFKWLLDSWKIYGSWSQISLFDIALNLFSLFSSSVRLIIVLFFQPYTPCISRIY